jgi:Autophagy protein Atg8 ubiquitin like
MQQSEMMKLSLEQRRDQSSRLLSKFAPKLPVIVERARASDPGIEKTKFLIDPNVTMAELLILIRRRVKLQPHQAVYLFVDNELVPSNATVREVYHHAQSRHPDGFLYITYCLENTFG